MKKNHSGKIKDVLSLQKGFLGIASTVMSLFPKLSQPVLGKNISQFMLSFPYPFFTAILMAERMRLCPSPGNVAAR